ncbi:MAG: hypothetical protein U0525_03990 [Patescibacteria group bacterium]
METSINSQNFSLRGGKIVRPNFDSLRAIPKEVKMSKEKELQFLEMVQNAKDSLARCLPGVSIKEPTKFVFSPGVADVQQDRLFTGGAYVGKIQEQHVILLTADARIMSSEGQFTREQFEIGVIAILHELIHQAHAEIVGQKNMMDENYQKALGNLLPDTVDYSDIQRLFDNEATKPAGEGLSLRTAIQEGVATLGELIYVNSRVRDYGLENDDKGVQILNRYHAYKIKSFADALRLYQVDSVRTASHIFGTAYAIGVVKIMRGLYKKYGFESIVKIVKKIDLDKCKDIRSNSPEFAAICEDVSLLPGLEEV